MYYAMAQMECDGRMSPTSVGVHSLMGSDLEDEGLLNMLVAGNSYGELLKLKVEIEEVFLDYLIGQQLDPTLVLEARSKEMEYVRPKGLWIKNPLKECWDKTGRPPVTVCVDINKGDNKVPNICSRLVARQIRGPGQKEVFAPFPPLPTADEILEMSVLFDSDCLMENIDLVSFDFAAYLLGG